jgi:hypothetical protein
MRKSLAAAVVLLLGAASAGAHDTICWGYYPTYYYPVYTVTSVPVYYAPVCVPVAQPVILAPARPVVVVPNLAVPTAAPPSQTREPPKAPAKTDKAPASKTERPPQLGEGSFYLNASRPSVGPPVVTGESRRDETVPVKR